MAEEGIKIIISNRQARYEYALETSFEAGIALLGTEVKSLRDGKANMQDAWCEFTPTGLALRGLHILPYTNGGYTNHEPTRVRRLLLHKEEIAKLKKGVEIKGYTIVPTKVYFKNGLCKIEIALGKGRKSHDKRDAIAERETKRSLDRARSGQREE